MRGSTLGSAVSLRTFGPHLLFDVHDAECATAHTPVPSWLTPSRAGGSRQLTPEGGLSLTHVRHAYATHALAAGLTAHAVARLLGHASAELVHRRYGHALPDELASAGDRLSAWRAAR
jgi:integrase